jgi:beta-galactosidase
VQTLFSDWTPADVSAHEENVEVYSNCDEVELLLNGKSLGSKPRAADDAPRTWRVAFEPGTISAIARNKGQVVASHEVRTAGKPAKVLLAADRKRIELDWNDLSTVTATVVDAQGVLVPWADNPITFQISGPGVITAVDSADNTSHEAFQGSQRRAFQGRCLAMVKASAARSRFTVTAASVGLVGSSVVIDTGDVGQVLDLPSPRGGKR